jgi:hypothetical protein
MLQFTSFDAREEITALESYLSTTLCQRGGVLLGEEVLKVSAE